MGAKGHTGSETETAVTINARANGINSARTKRNVKRQGESDHSKSLFQAVEGIG